MAETVQRRAEDRVEVIHRAQMRVERDTLSYPVTVRNLSTQGMMGEGPVPVASTTFGA